jgi:serine/threonine protein kinase
MNSPPITVREVFDQAHEISSPEERSAYLDRACAGAPEVRQQVEALLRAYEAAGNSFLKSPVLPPDATGPYVPQLDRADSSAGPEPETVDTLPPTDHPPADEGPGSQIGPYRLVRPLGEGGMGAVYLAEQERPIRRQVALKIIKPGRDNARIVARFEAERQALTLMDHPSIARVFDAGTTAAGLPYFVMELVQGVPMNLFCNDSALSVRERLGLFVPVCQAIQHAHQKGIIHRDIKPSNVLVALQDGRPVPKVIDFGIAKATEQPLTEHSQLTQAGEIVGTLKYMSPEQAGGSARGVDTRSDVYSLGVMLYELLTGTTPLDGAAARGADLITLVMRIREEEPPKPSERVLTLGERLAKVAEQRKTEPARLAKALRGELDWIVMTALEKDRQRRYETASDFAKDVQRYLDDEPVEACPPSRSYRLRKFARKHRAPLIAAGGIVAALVCGVIGLTWGVIAANRARQKASLVAGVTREALVVVLDQNRAPLQTRARLGETEEASLRAMLQTYRQLVSEPGASRELRTNAAQTEWGVAALFALAGVREDAEEGFRRAIELYKVLADETPGDEGYHARNELGRCYFDLAYHLAADPGRRPEAVEAYRKAIELHRQVSAHFADQPAYASDLADDYNNLGALLRDQKDLASAEEAFRQAVALGEQATAGDPRSLPFQIKLAASYGNLGNVVRDRGHPNDSLAWYGKDILLLRPLEPLPDDARRFLRNAHWDRANALVRLGEHVAARKDWELAYDLEATADLKGLGYFHNAAQADVDLKAGKPMAEQLYKAAEAHARAMAAAATVGEDGLHDQYAGRALDLLKQARDAGWFRDPWRVKQLKDDKEFAGLPGEEFKRFLEGLDAGKGAPDKPDKD